jgi:hypothetical protein
LGIFFAGVPDWLLHALQASGRYGLAIETGTFRGDSALVLADAVGRCTTIELDPALAAAATERFASDSRINVVQGSSRDVMPRTVRDLTGPTFFWLDGHWSGGVTAGADDPCPLDGELDAIATSPMASDCMVAIDDARLCGFPRSNEPDGNAYPSILEVLSKLSSMGLYPYVVDDVILGVPEADRAIITAPERCEELRHNTPIFRYWGTISRRTRGRAAVSGFAGRLTRRG